MLNDSEIELTAGKRSPSGVRYVAFGYAFMRRFLQPYGLSRPAATVPTAKNAVAGARSPHNQ